MRILLLGNTGQLGYEVERALAPLGEVIALDYPQVDFANPQMLTTLVQDLRPQVIYNAVAYTAVDRAETEPDKARLINAVAPGVLAEAARAVRAVLFHVSTDYVFDGTKGAPYIETDDPHPLNTYGQTKLEGDLAVMQSAEAYWVLRTAWVFSNRRDSFVSKVLLWARSQTTLKIVDDQVSNPTWARMLAEASALMIAQGGANLYDYAKSKRGLYHIAGEGFASRYQWAKEILANDPNPSTQTVKEVLPTLTQDFPLPAARPLYNPLACDKFTRTFGLRLPLWQSALRWAMQG